MATQAEKKQSQATSTESTSLLEQAVAATRNTERSRTEQLLKTLTSEALKGTVSWNKNLSATINEAIAKIDEKISKQVTKILHAPEVQKLEGSWRGLHYLIKNSSTSELLKVKLFNAKKIFKKISTKFWNLLKVLCLTKFMKLNSAHPAVNLMVY